MNLIIRLLVNGLAILIVSWLLPGVEVGNMLNAVMVAAVLALLNYFVKPLLIVLTIPVTIFTLGLFLLVINALIIMLADKIVPGFEVRNFWWALLFSILLSIVNSFFGASDKNRDRQQY